MKRYNFATSNNLINFILKPLLKLEIKQHDVSFHYMFKIV
jgi:hypothetical protein